MAYNNPFTPVFGNEPPIFAGRESLIAKVLGGLGNTPGDPYRVTVFTGPRGSGKTALLSKIASEAEGMGWISASTFTSAGLLEDLQQQVEERAAEFLTPKKKAKLTGVQVYGTGATVERLADDALNWRTQMGRYLTELNEQSIGLLFTVDEIQSNPELTHLVSVFQMFIREKRNVALLMAGLPSKVLQLSQDDETSFYRRAFHRELAPVSQAETRTTIKKTVELSGRHISTDALELAAQQTQGFPFMIQLIGYHAFSQSDAETITYGDVKAGLEDAREDMETMILEATIKDLSEKDIDFHVVMQCDKEVSNMADIAKRLKVSASYAGNYRSRLIAQGVITEAGRGKVAFQMSLFRALFAEKYGE
jgi:AAA+ ATPase superfamily predicted ATPase